MSNNPSGTHEKHILGYGKSLMLLTISSLTLIFILTLTGCGKKEMSQQSYSDAETALADYHSFSNSLAKKESVTTSQLIEAANQWKHIVDEVSKALVKESTLPTDSLNAMRYMALRDSITEQFDRLVDSRERTLSDYVQVAKNVTANELDSATVELSLAVHKFYANLDDVNTLGKDAKGTVIAYDRLLEKTIEDGFSDKESVFNFLREEDRAFRSFLEKLPELGALELEGIRDGTTQIMSDIVKLAATENPILGTDEVVVLLTMRTSRRLLQNALQCVNDIRMKKVRGTDQSIAYQWMLIQPWITFDGFAYAMMSDAQWRVLGILATETPKCLAQIGATDFPIPLEELPALLIKTHISTL